MDNLLAHAQAYKETKDAEKEFVEGCKEWDSKIKADQEAIKSQLGVFLEAHPSAKLKSGKYLSIKTSVSTKQLNADRVREGFMKVDQSTAKTCQKARPGASAAVCICAAVELKLNEVCSTTTKTPQVVSGAPKDLPKGVFTVTAPAEVEKLCNQLKESQDQIKVISAHKKTGKQQCAPLLAAEQDAVSLVLDQLAPPDKSVPVEIRMIPEPSLKVDGDSVELPELPLGEDSAPIMVEKKGNKKRKVAVFEAVVKGLDTAIKIKRKPKKASNPTRKITVADFVCELQRRLEEDNVTIAMFFNNQQKMSEEAVQLLEDMTPTPLDEPLDDNSVPSCDISIH
jgi:hypothetical protein